MNFTNQSPFLKILPLKHLLKWVPYRIYVWWRKTSKFGKSLVILQILPMYFSSVLCAINHI